MAVRQWNCGRVGMVVSGALVMVLGFLHDAEGVKSELIPLREVARDLIEETGFERLYSLALEDATGERVDAYLRRPATGYEEPMSGYPIQGVVLVAGRYAGREAVALIPGRLPSVMLAVEYPQSIPADMGVWGWIRSLPAIRRSARRMPGILRGAAYYLAELPEIDATRVGLVGVSFGVPFAAAAGSDPIFRAVALHYGGSGLASLFHANLAVENQMLRRMLAGFAGWWFRDLDPSRHVGGISPTPLLLINALGDTQIPRSSAELLGTLARPPVRQIWLPYGHLDSGARDVIREVADSTFGYFDRAMAGR
jgi:fermentation-respiration switch protein FrsA (DUF1100 family)